MLENGPNQIGYTPDTKYHSLNIHLVVYKLCKVFE